MNNGPANDAISVSSSSADYCPASPTPQLPIQLPPSPAGSYYPPRVLLGLPSDGCVGTPYSGNVPLADRIGERVTTPDPRDDNPDDYLIGSSEELHDTWELCKAALLFYREARTLPGDLTFYTAQIFSEAVESNPPASLEAAQREHDNYLRLVGTLRAWCAELQEYVVPNLISLSAAASVGREPSLQ